MLLEVFASVLLDEFFTIPTKEAKECLKAAQEVVQKLSNPTQLHLDFSSWLMCSLKAVVYHASKQNGINREKMWSSFYCKTSSDNFTSHWKQFASAIGINITPLLYQHATDKLLNQVIKKLFSLYQSMDDYGTKSDLSNEHENTVHYVGGYVLHKLKGDPSNQDLYHFSINLHAKLILVIKEHLMNGPNL